MAEKGDFPECEKCTSFQCKSCGLEASRGDGYITGRKNAFKACIYMTLAVIVPYVLHLDQMTFSKMIFLLVFPLLGMYIIIQYQISVIFVYLLLLTMSASYFLI